MEPQGTVQKAPEKPEGTLLRGTQLFVAFSSGTIRELTIKQLMTNENLQTDKRHCSPNSGKVLSKRNLIGLLHCGKGKVYNKQFRDRSIFSLPIAVLGIMTNEGQQKDKRRHAPISGKELSKRNLMGALHCGKKRVSNKHSRDCSFFPFLLQSLEQFTCCLAFKCKREDIHKPVCWRE